jgi:hypothetical protein
MAGTTITKLAQYDDNDLLEEMTRRDQRQHNINEAVFTARHRGQDHRSQARLRRGHRGGRRCGA